MLKYFLVFYEGIIPLYSVLFSVFVDGCRSSDDSVMIVVKVMGSSGPFFARALTASHVGKGVLSPLGKGGLLIKSINRSSCV